MVEIKKKIKKRKNRKVTKPINAVPTTVVEEKPKVEAPQPVVKKKVSRRLIMIGVGCLGMLLGAGSVISYFFTMNLILGAPGVIMGIGGFFLARHYWQQEEDLVVEQMPLPKAEKYNTLCIYPDRVQFEQIDKPKGFPWKSRNDGRRYYVMIYDLPGDGASPQAFQLPDQQFVSPEYFAERPITLPAHKKLFSRREKLGQYIKTALLVVAIVIEWLLIITTTGGG